MARMGIPAAGVVRLIAEFAEVGEGRRQLSKVTLAARHFRLTASSFPLLTTRLF
jgi:hypothetical protein